MKNIFILLLLITAMSIHAQELFSTYGNCTRNTYGFVSVVNKTSNIPPIYCNAGGFSEGLAAVQDKAKWGYIDSNNKAVIDFEFDYAARFKHGQAIVQQGELRGVIDKRGNYLIQPVYLDLQALEIGGKLYYLSRDSTFFAGLIDSAGNEIIPHQFTYILPTEGYRNIPFYTVFQEIDTTKGSFYDQFEDNPFRFSPEEGRHDIYDLRFDKLASKQSIDYLDGFQHDQLRRIDAFLNENGHKNVDEKVKAIDRLLALPEPESAPQLPSLYREYQSRESWEVDKYLDSLGYRLFTEYGKTGLKKGNDILIPAQYTDLRRVNGVILFPQKEDISFLKMHYGGTYRNKEKGIFDVFGVIPFNGEPTEATLQYSLSGEIILPLTEADGVSEKRLSSITSLGFMYLHTAQDPSGQEIETYGLVNWKGEELLPPVYQKIEAANAGHVLVTKEVAAENGIEEHVGLVSPTGEEIIPMGVYSAIKPFFKGTGNLYLATWSDPYPTTAEREEGRYENKTYVILNVEGNASRVVNTFTASMVYVGQLDTETGMLQYTKNIE